MRYRLLASYQGAPYEAGVGPADSDVVLFAACPPPEELRFEPATGHWRKEVRLADVQTLHESRPVGMFRGERCVVLDDLNDRLHIVYLGHDAYRAEQIGYWEIDRGVFELITPRQEVTDIVEQRLAFPHRGDGTWQPSIYGPEADDLLTPGLQAAGVGPVAQSTVTPGLDVAGYEAESHGLVQGWSGRGPDAGSGRAPDAGFGRALDPGSGHAPDPGSGRGPAFGPPIDEIASAADLAAGPVPEAGSDLTATPGYLTATDLGGVTMPMIDEPPLPLEAQALRAATAAHRRDQPDYPARQMSQPPPVQDTPTGLAEALDGAPAPAARPAQRPPQSSPTAQPAEDAPPNTAMPAQDRPSAAAQQAQDRPSAADPPGPRPARPPAAAQPAQHAATAVIAPVKEAPQAAARPSQDGTAAADSPGPRPARPPAAAQPAQHAATAVIAPAKDAPEAAVGRTQGSTSVTELVKHPGAAVAVPVRDAPNLTAALFDAAPQPVASPASETPASETPASETPPRQAPARATPDIAAAAPRQEPSAMPGLAAQPTALQDDADEAESLPAAVPRRRRAAKRRLPTQRIFSDLATQAAIPANAYAVGEDVDGAMCLMRTADGFEVFNSAAGARHEVRVFQDEESAYFYLFGVLVADAVRTGALAPRE